ncbi:MAG: hypothetical protein ACJ8ER_02195 [Allosphingosinicella sp.]
MIKRRIAATLLVAGVMSLAGPATANHGQPVYNTHYFSDATYTQEIGFDQGDCCYFGACYSSHTGQSSNYIQYEQIGYCAKEEYGPGSYWEPL